MSEEKLVPKLRFAGFTEEWNKYFLSDVIESFVNGQTPSRNVDSYWNGDIPWVSSGELNYNHITSTIEQITEEGKKNANLKLIPSGTFLMAITGLEAAGTRGSCAILDIDATTNQSCMALFPKKEKLTTKFLYYWYLKVGEHYGIKYTQGTKQQSYNKELLEKLPIILPNNTEEQNKITDFLSSLNRKIELLNKKYDNYVNFKKYLMQQIFAQKLRFDFKDEWHELRLKDVAYVPKKTKLSNIDGLNLLTVKLHTKGIEINDKIKPKLTKRGRPYYIREYGELLIGRQNFHNGGMGLVPKSLDGGICSNAISSFKVFEDKINLNYLYYFLARPEYYKKSERLIGGTGQKEFSEKELLKLKIDMPSLQEQSKIVNLFLTMDNKINNCENQLLKSQEFKKGLLQQMFV